jgi:type IV pilus assembly protein PilB
VEGSGCEQCRNTGYRGRLGIHEVLLLGDDFRDGILGRAPSRELRALARRTPGFMSLEEAGLLRVAAGATTLSEVADNVPRDAGARTMAELGEIATKRSVT